MNYDVVRRIIFCFTFLPNFTLQDHDDLTKQIDNLMGDIKQELEAITEGAQDINVENAKVDNLINSILNPETTTTTATPRIPVTFPTVPATVPTTPTTTTVPTTPTTTTIPTVPIIQTIPTVPTISAIPTVRTIPPIPAIPALPNSVLDPSLDISNIEDLKDIRLIGESCQSFGNKSFQELRVEFLLSTFDDEQFREKGKDEAKPRVGEQFFFPKADEKMLKKKILKTGKKSGENLLGNQRNLKNIVGDQTFYEMFIFNRLRNLHNLWFVSDLPRPQKELYLKLLLKAVMDTKKIYFVPSDPDKSGNPGAGGKEKVDSLINSILNPEEPKHSVVRRCFDQADCGNLEICHSGSYCASFCDKDQVRSNLIIITLYHTNGNLLSRAAAPATSAGWGCACCSTPGWPSPTRRRCSPARPASSVPSTWPATRLVASHRCNLWCSRLYFWPV